MMQGARAARVEESLRKNGRTDQEVIRAAVRLAPFMEIAAKGAYALAAEDSVDRADVAMAIQMAIGKPVTEISLMSWGTFSRLHAQYRSAYLKQEGANLKHGLWIRLIHEHGQELADSFGDPDRRQELHRAWDQDVGSRLRSVHEALFRAFLGGDLWLNCWNNVEECVHYFLGFVRAGDVARADRLEPLVGLLPKAVPLCESQTKPGVWIVLVK